MTVEAQRPAGRPGTAPRGPAGPRPEPYGPSTPGPQPSAPPPPAPPAPSRGVLLALDDALAAICATARRIPGPADQVEACGLAILDFRLGRARAAVADLLAYRSPARQGLSALPRESASASAGGPVSSGRDGKAVSGDGGSRPVQPPVTPSGERLTPGSGTAICPAVTESDRAVVAPVAGVQPPAGQPPLPGGDFLLPRDIRLPVFESMAPGGEGGS
jgi:hypothetical protein